MDVQSLQTASHYVNNLLLSRGLLRNGVPIEFAAPAQGEGGSAATMAKIINLVHDMVLRRDRENETTISLSQTATTLRTTLAQQSQAVSRLESKRAELERQLSLATSQERTASSSLKLCDNRNRALREDMARLKATVGQIRAQCANDVRKRDAEITRLKKHLDSRRGRDASAQVGVTLIVPGVTKPKDFAIQKHEAIDLQSPSYSLKEETTDFLTRLSQDLSDENDAMIGLVRNTLDTLRELQGLTSSLQINHTDAFADPNIAVNMPPSYETLAAGMDEALEHLRSLLTNPSFVPLEEVEVREEEIIRLREGWDKMETRWREALSLMNGWRRRMMETGDTINLDDLRKGLNLDADDLLPCRSSNGQSITSRLSNESEDLSNGIEQDEEQVKCDLDAEIISPVRDDTKDIFQAPAILKATSGNARPSSSSKHGSHPVDSPTKAIARGAISHEDEIDLIDDLANWKQSPQRKKRKSDEMEADLTIQEKLKKAEEDALKAVKVQSRPETISNPPKKRTAIPRKVRSKRRSTLSPEELESLMGIA